MKAKSRLPQSIQEAIQRGYRFGFNDEISEELPEDGEPSGKVRISKGFFCLSKGERAIAVPFVAVRTFGKPVAVKRGGDASEEERARLVYPKTGAIR